MDNSHLLFDSTGPSFTGAIFISWSIERNNSCDYHKEE